MLWVLNPKSIHHWLSKSLPRNITCLELITRLFGIQTDHQPSRCRPLCSHGMTPSNRRLLRTAPEAAQGLGSPCSRPQKWIHFPQEECVSNLRYMIRPDYLYIQAPLCLTLRRRKANSVV